MVVGLPTAQLTEHRERLMDMLTGQHRVELYGRGGECKRVAVTVTEVRVLPQPLGFGICTSCWGMTGK
ncbi:MAG: hypothetical protein AAGA68_18990 [Pseudomonadota bacterium]